MRHTLSVLKSRRLSSIASRTLAFAKLPLKNPGDLVLMTKRFAASSCPKTSSLPGYDISVSDPLTCVQKRMGEDKHSVLQYLSL